MDQQSVDHRQGAGCPELVDVVQHHDTRRSHLVEQIFESKPLWQPLMAEHRQRG